MRSVLCVALLGACGGPSQTRPTPPTEGSPADTSGTTESRLQPPEQKPAKPAAPAVSAECSLQATRLGGALRDLSTTQPGFLPIVPGIKAPVSKAAKPIDTRGIVIAVAKDGTMYMQGDKLTDVAMAREYLDQVHRRALEKIVMDGGTAADATLPLYIWADRATPVRVIAALAAAANPEPEKPGKAKAKGKDAKLPPVKLEGKPVPDDDPPPPEDEDPQVAREQALQAARDAGLLGKSVGKRPPEFLVRLLVTSADNAPALDSTIGVGLPPSEPEATRLVVGMLKTAIGTCNDIMTSLGTMSLAGTPAKEAAKVIEEVPAGLTGCNCKGGNPDELVKGMRLWFGAWAPALKWIDLPKLKATDKHPIGKLVK